MFKKSIVFLSSVVLLANLGPSSPAQADSYDGYSGSVNCTSGGSVLIENNVVVPRTQYVYDSMMDFGYDERIPSDCSGSVVIPVGVTGIAGSAFEGATALNSVSLPSTLLYIDSWAFYNSTALTSLTIPASVTSIGGMVFGNTYSLTSINVDAANQNYSSVDGVLFDKNVTRLLKYPSAKSDTSYVIPNGVTVIDYSAAISASALTSLTIPESVTLIAYFSFEYASYLKDIYFLGNAPIVEWRAFGNVANGAKAYVKSGSTGFAAVGSSWNDLTVATAANPSYSVTFNSKNGTAVSAGTFTASGSVVAPTSPIRAGYNFAGWSATDGGSAVSFPYSPGVTEDITLYALWSAKSNVVTYNSNGGSAVTAGSFATGGSLVAPAAPTRSGYTFAGWSATNGGSAVSFPYSPNVTEDITLYAKWTAKTFAVSYNSKGGTSIAAGSFTTGGSVASAPKVPTRSGYTFAGWSATDGGSAVSFPYSPGVASIVTLYAKWTVLPPVMGLTSASTLLPGSLVSLNISRVNQGCTVTVGWTDSSSGIDPVSKVVKSDRTTGVFTIATPTTAGTYTLSTSEIGAECAGGSAVTLTQSVVVGKSLSITAKVSSSSGYAAKSPVFSVTGTVKSGSVAVSGKQVSVSLRRNGVEVNTATGTTSSTGALSVVFTGTTYVAGDYTAVITGVSDSTYLAAQVTTAKLTLR